jgi:hypothetical protein
MIDFKQRAAALLSKADPLTAEYVEQVFRKLAADVLNAQADRMSGWRVLEGEGNILNWTIEDIRACATAIKDGKQ